MQTIQGQRAYDQCEDRAIHIARMGEGAGHGQDTGAYRSLQEVGKGLPVAVKITEDIPQVLGYYLIVLTLWDSSPRGVDGDRNHRLYCHSLALWGSLIPVRLLGRPSQFLYRRYRGAITTCL